MKIRLRITVTLMVFLLSFLLSSCSAMDNLENSAVDTETETPIITEIATANDEVLKNESALTTSEPSLDNIQQLEQELVVKVGDSIPVSRALAAKMLTLAFSDAYNIDMLEREITFSDCEPDKWYDRYINAAVLNGIMSGGGEEFMPDKPLTVYQAQLLLDKLDPKNQIKMQITEENSDKPISYALWTDLYIQLLRNLSENGNIHESFGISAKSIIPLATPETNSRLTGSNMITDTGPVSYSGFVMEQYIDQLIGVLIKDGELLAVLFVEDIEPVIKNVYVVGHTDDEITIFTGGAERTYALSEPIKTEMKTETSKIADIKISGKNALSVVFYNDYMRGVLKRSTPDFIEIENNPIINTDENYKVYSDIDGSVRWRSLSNVIVGTDTAEYFIDNGVIKAIIITDTATPNNLRVALHTTGHSGLVHKNVELTATSAFSVNFGNEVKNFEANELFTVSQDMFNDYPRIYINCTSEDGRILLKSIKRNWSNGESPAYRGTFEIALENDGYSIVNELSMEEYLYSVIPSEMPTSHGLEAAKVQAVTARSYSYTQFFSNRFHRYGGNVDDSVSSQVYNNIPENITSITAVNETAGQCLTFNGNVITANFFSTSSGMTANSGEVWANSSTRQFPTSSASYLQSSKQWTHDTNYGDLSIESNAEVFFKSLDIESFDSAFSWFRWNTTMTAEEISASINHSIKTRYQTNPRLIKTLQPTGVFLSRPIESIGKLVDLEIVSRGEGGNIMQMKITGTEATVLILTEYNIRLLLAPIQRTSSDKPIVLRRKDSTIVENYTIMPSSFFVMDKETDASGALTSVTFYGGGNGHGVGMSQNGVKGMIDAGFNFNEILSHYYNGTEIKTMISLN